MTKEEVEEKKASLVAAGKTPMVCVCSVCKKVFDVKEGGENMPPHLRVSHDVCSDYCTERFLFGRG